MKKLIMCEGPNELAIINLLLDADLLNFSRNDLVGLSAYFARQIDKSAVVQTQLRLYNGEFEIIRIGDKMTDKLRIPKDYEKRISSVIKYCTKPELEMLLIISENLFDEFNKEKSKTKPKDFAKSHIRCGNKRYNNSTQFYIDFYQGDEIALVDAIKGYAQRNKSHKGDEHYLAELLK